MISEVIAENGDVLVAQYDEMDEVYGCEVRGQEDSLVRCWKCDWESCPMRGGKRGAN
ncbi:hypothetical protein M0R72_18850 [Candidatus Pacearchaeota archaeon]|jgi:hypothetical protein|nr:hypothetical protein [Candidatus Pacearchaeota archaeon]